MYTNGFDLDAVLPALKGRIGWSSESGNVRKFESFHALAQEQNLRDTQPTENITDEAFTNYKDDLEDQIIQRCLSSVFSTPEYLDQVLLHKRIPGTAKQLITNTDQFCGLRIRIAPDFSISTWIKSVTLLFDSTITFHLYLYEDGNPEPLTTIEVDTVANVPTVFELEDLLLSYASLQSTNFYFGYYQNDLLNAKAIREQVCWNKTRCFGVDSFTIDRSKVASGEFNTSYTYDTFGINAEMHSFRDYTYKIVNAPHLFDEAIGLSMVYFLIEQILSTTRSTSAERILKSGFEKIELTHYLYGSVPAMGVAKITGLNEVINKKFSDIRESIFPKPKAITVNLC
jgi:hypothetical protein